MKYTPSNLYIVNDVDRPCEELIACLDPIGGLLYYIHPETTYSHGMDPSQATPLEEFGIMALIEGGILSGIALNNTEAKYPDGRLRRWQGSKKFSFKIKKVKALRNKEKK